MLEIHKINTGSKEQVGEFVRIPFSLYKNHPQWVPPLFIDAEMQLNRDKHPFYEHSSADFFIAKRDNYIIKSYSWQTLSLHCIGSVISVYLFRSNEAPHEI